MSEASRLLAGDRQASVEDIAIAAGVSRTTFYRAFPSRAQLLRAIEVQPEPDTRDRVLEASIQMLGTQTLKELSMDALASQAAVSRANLYHLFPGKSALLIGNFANEPNTFLRLENPKKLFFADAAMAEGIAGPSRMLLKFGTF